jgi:hypothetical protein
MIHSRSSRAWAPTHLSTVANALVLLAVVTVIGVVGVVGCTGSDPDPYDYPPSREAVTPLDGQMLFPVRLDDHPGYFQMVVDTGAFATAVDERLVRDMQNDVGVVTLDFGEGLVFEDLRVFAAYLSLAENHIGVPIHGLIGQDIVQQMFFGLDYQASEVTAASPIPGLPPPAFADTPGIDVPYTLEQLMPVVEVDIGGLTARLIADTGSGVTLLTESFVSALLLETGLTGYWWHTSYGSDPGTIVRLPSLEIGGHEVVDSWAVVVPDDYHLRPTFDALGVEVDGFLGFPVYRRFYVAVHGPESRFRFYPYADLSHVDPREWDRVGLEIRREEDLVRVDMVFGSSDASAMGVSVDDVLYSIDDEPVADLALDEVRLLLRGTPGEIKTLELERAGAPVTLQVAVDRLLPLLN